ncbi:hypothetical protein AOG2_24560 [Geobacter sp. AOG2]|nr:hypothetical protein AOG2_24560 [Geobacter sp. AOG2]
MTFLGLQVTGWTGDTALFRFYRSGRINIFHVIPTSLRRFFLSGCRTKGTKLRDREEVSTSSAMLCFDTLVQSTQ